MRVVIVRAIHAVLQLKTLSEKSMEMAVTAPTDLAVLLRALQSGEMLADLRSIEPLAPALVRGIEAKRRLIEDNGGVISAEHAAQNLGISSQAINKRRQAGKLLAFSFGQKLRYPVWQFTRSGVLPGLADVLGVLRSHDEWMQAAFFVAVNPRLGDRSPIEMLRGGHLREVLDAAQAYGEHGAA